MFKKLVTVFRIPELRRKIVLTLILLAIYRMGFSIPLPFVDQEQLALSQAEQSDGSDPLGRAMQVVSLFSASSLSNATIFGLGIMPYISASIIFQLLGSVYPPLEQLQKEGESGRRKITEWTRYATVLICIGQSFFWIKQLSGGTFTGGRGLIIEDYDWWLYYVLGTVVMTAGTIFLMWIGEQIDAYGIGNGISLLIMAGILAQMPGAGYDLLRPAIKNGVAIGSDMGIDKLLLLTLLFAGVVAWVVFITQGQRKIPIQSQKHVRGRKSGGGQRQSLPLRVNQAGVMPIIFASSLLMFPMFLFGYLSSLPALSNVTILRELDGAFGGGQGFIYNLLYVGLIYFFCYFWTAITFNPKDMAENLKDYGSFIPGYRPGARTANHLEAVMVRITYVGAAFLALVAIIPTIISSYLGINYVAASFYGGTGLLIAVSVILDLVQKIDSHLVMRNYPGLLDADV